MVPCRVLQSWHVSCASRGLAELSQPHHSQESHNIIDPISTVLSSHPRRGIPELASVSSLQRSEYCIQPFLVPLAFTINSLFSSNLHYRLAKSGRYLSSRNRLSFFNYNCFTTSFEFGFSAVEHLLERLRHRLLGGQLILEDVSSLTRVEARH
jgi:hypothetical protein